MDANDLGVITAGRFARKCAEAGWEPKEFEEITVEDLQALRDVRRGLSEIKVIDHIVNCSRMPKLPSHTEVVEHKGSEISKIERRADGLYVQGRKVMLCLNKAQQSGTIEGHLLRGRLIRKQVLDANILDYLMDHQNLIPEGWKLTQGAYVRSIYFWGTIFRNMMDGHLGVRGLHWRNHQWQLSYRSLDDNWDVLSLSAQLEK